MAELSVIIPTYNRAESLRACLESLAQQKQPAADFEVVVVVDGSTDNTREILAELDLPYALRVVCQENRGLARARNHGIEASQGRFCLFLDDDMLAAPSLVSAHLRCQRDGGGVVALGQITLSGLPDDDWFVHSYSRSWRQHYERLNEGVRLATWSDCYGGNFSAPREALVALGAFADDLPYAEDTELSYRLKRHGLTTVYIAEACAEQNDYKDYRRVAADAEKSGMVCLHIWRRHPAVLPELLGDFNASKLRVILLRRLLLVCSVPPLFLIWLGRLLRTRSQRDACYRFIYQYCYWRGVRRAVPDRVTWQRLTHGTTILMYHAFAEKDEQPHRFIVPRHKFSRQMQFLKLMRYRVISLEDYVEHLRSYRLPPARSVVITMDDGYRDNRTVAFPVLRRFRFPATVFLVSGSVGECNNWDDKDKLTGRALLSWTDIEELRASGISFGAHTRTHPRLTEIASEELGCEIHGSHADLAEVLSPSTALFAYPYGDYDEAVSEEVEAAGYAASCSVESGINMPATDMYALRRVEVWGTDSLMHFALSLWLGDARKWLRR